MNSLFKVVFFVLFISTQLWAQTESKIPQDFCISQQEYRLYSLVNTYRSKLALESIPLSKSLCFVARTHAKDLAANYPMGDDCNMHSWSNQGNWKSFCFPAEQSRKNDIKDQAKAISDYPGKAWEITYWENSQVDVAFVLEFWNSISYSAAMIGNTGKWGAKKWKSMGIGIQDGYVLLWLGEEVDVEAGTPICETGEVISNNSVAIVVTKEADTSEKEGNNEQYYIVIGSFSQASDAETAVSSYHQMGYPNAKKIETQGRIRVVIDSFNSQEKAEAALIEYKNKFQGAWILTF